VRVRVRVRVRERVEGRDWVCVRGRECVCVPKLCAGGSAPTSLCSGVLLSHACAVTWSNRRLEYFRAIRNVYIVYLLLPRNMRPPCPLSPQEWGEMPNARGPNARGPPCPLSPQECPRSSRGMRSPSWRRSSTWCQRQRHQQHRPLRAQLSRRLWHRRLSRCKLSTCTAAWRSCCVPVSPLPSRPPICLVLLGTGLCSLH